MKKSQKWQKLITTVAAGTFIIAALLAGESQVMAQDAVLPPLPPGSQYEQNANESYSVIADGTGHVVIAGSGGFHAADGSGPPSPPGASGSGGGTNVPGGPYLPDPGTNLWLLIQQVGSTVVVTLSNTVAGSNYLLLASTNVDGPWVTNQSLLAPAGNLAVAYPIGILANSNLFFIAEQAPAPGPLALKWVTNLVSPTNGYVDGNGTGIDSSPAISPMGPIYINTGNSNIFCLDPIFGDVLWTNSPPDLPPGTLVPPGAGEFQGSAAVGQSGTIYAGFFDGSLHAYDPLGLPLWTNAGGSGSASYTTPAVTASGQIIETLAAQGTDMTVYDSGVESFSLGGSTNWLFQPQNLFYNYGGTTYGTAVEANPVAGPDGTVYFYGEGSRFHAVSSTGHLKFFLPMTCSGGAAPPPNPALEPDGSIIVGDLYGNLYCLNPDGSLRWTVNCNALIGSANFGATQPVIGPGGVIYTAGCPGILSLNPDGTTNWYFPDPNGNLISTTPALAADGTLYFGDNFGDNDGNFYALSTNGTLIASTNLGAAIYSSPAIAPDGSVVVAGENGSVYCFLGSAPLETNCAMPMYQHDPAHSGQVSTNIAYEPFDDCGAPFVFNGDNDGNGHFFFSMTGTPGTSNWCVYTSTNLASTNWTLLATNITLDPTYGNAYFTNDVAEGTAAEFYVVSRSNCNSKVIGFVSNSVPPGCNLVADQLYQVDDGILLLDDGVPMNTLNALFGVSNAWGAAQSEAIISKWNGTSFDSVTNGGYQSPQWYGSGTYAYAPGEMTMVPGMSVFMNNVTNAPFPVWFNGLVREQQIFHVDPGTNAYSTNFFSATVPEGGYITEITGYVPGEGDMVQLWTNQAFLSYHYASGVWSTNGVASGAPAVDVGEGFVLITSNAYTWTNSWQPAPP